MYPWTHFIFGGFFGAIAYYVGLLTPEQTLIVAILAALVDIDHYISYIVSHNHEFSFKKIWNECVLGHFHGRSFIHGPIGLGWITLVLFGIYWISFTWFLIFALAYYSHYLLDHLHIHMKKELNINKFGFHLHLFYLELVIGIVVKGLTILLLII